MAEIGHKGGAFIHTVGRNARPMDLREPPMDLPPAAIFEAPPGQTIKTIVGAGGGAGAGKVHRTGVTPADVVGAALAPNCPAFYVLNVSDPTHPICEPGPVLQIPGVGWVWAHKDLALPGIAAGLVATGGLHLFGVNLLLALGIGAIVAVAVGYGIAFVSLSYM